MTSEHYEKAEECLAKAAKANLGPMADAEFKAAQVHATLALADEIHSANQRLNDGLAQLIVKTGRRG
jgi:hemoglobin-like flavoprotein